DAVTSQDSSEVRQTKTGSRTPSCGSRRDPSADGSFPAYWAGAGSAGAGAAGSTAGGVASIGSVCAGGSPSGTAWVVVPSVSLQAASPIRAIPETEARISFFISNLLF